VPMAVRLGLFVRGQRGRLAAAIVLAAIPFVCWDLLAAHAGQWHFDAAQTLPPRILGLPLEEYAFFAVIPFCAVVTYEGVGAVLARPAGERQ
jgi:lycopene cyclase domain-containing protein